MLIRYEFDPEIGMVPLVSSEPSTDFEADPYLEDFPITEEPSPEEDVPVQTVYVGLSYDELVTFYNEYLYVEPTPSPDPIMMVSENSFFDTPLAELSVTDTLLVILVLVTLAAFIRNFLGGIFS